jgi:hypothetical protein
MQRTRSWRMVSSKRLCIFLPSWTMLKTIVFWGIIPHLFRIDSKNKKENVNESSDCFKIRLGWKIFDSNEKLFTSSYLRILVVNDNDIPLMLTPWKYFLIPAVCTQFCCRPSTQYNVDDAQRRTGLAAFFGTELFWIHDVRNSGLILINCMSLRSLKWST